MSTLATPATFTATGGLNIDTSSAAIAAQAGAKSFTADGKLRATVTVPTSITWVHGLPFNDSGELVVVDSSSATGTYRANGILLSASGAVVCVSEGGAVGPIVEAQGLKFDAAGAVLVEGLSGLSLNFLSGTLDPRVTFSRPSNATKVDSLGRIVWAPAQLCTRGNTFDTGWSMGASGYVVPDYGVAPSGRPSALCVWDIATPTAGNAIVSQAIVVGASATLQIKLRRGNWRWMRVAIYSNSNGTNQVRCWVDMDNGVLSTTSNSGAATDAAATLVTLSDGWLLVTLSGIVPFTSGSDGAIIIGSATDDGNTTRQGDGASVEMAECVLKLTDSQTGDLFLDDNFATEGAAYYGPRFDYNPTTLVPVGLLLEEARANHFHNSALQAGYISSGLAFVNYTTKAGWVVANAQTNGGGIANLLVFNGLTTISPTTQYTLSCIFEKISAGGRYFQLRIGTGISTANTEYINVDYDTVTVTQVGAAASNAFVEELDDGWLFAGFTFTSSGSPGGTVPGALSLVDLATSGWSGTYTTAGHVYRCYLAQLEPGSFATSRIPTYGSAATRAADIATVSPVAWATALPAAALYVDMRSYGTRVLSGSVSFAQLDDGTTTNRIAIRAGGVSGQNQVTWVDGGVVSFNTTVPPGGYDPRKVLLTWDAVNFKSAANGTVLFASTAHGGVPTVTQLSIGGTNSLGAFALNGHIASIRGYSLAAIMSDAQLETLTA